MVRIVVVFAVEHSIYYLVYEGVCKKVQEMSSSS